ncbi:MAG: hypothetical protein MUC50_11610 [Myxococcota bacterium]|jgi:hypothetical protein|nr:hypothetical protein [Myxococcota bacterium]
MHKPALLLLAISVFLAWPTRAEDTGVKGDPVDEAKVELPPDCPVGSVEGASARRAAGKWFAQGELLVSEEKFVEAVAAFMCSFKLVQHPNTLFNTAQAAMLLGDTPLALSMLRRYIREAPNGPMASDVQQRIADLEKRVQTSQEPPPPVEEPEPEVTPPPTPPPPPVAPPLLPPAKRTWQRPLGIAAIGLAGAGAVTGVLLHALAGVAQREGKDTSDFQVFEEQKDKMNGLQTGAFVCYGVAAAATVAGVILLIRDDTEKPDRTITVTPSANGVALSWEF